MSKESQFIEALPVERFDSTTSEHTNRGIVTDSAMSARNRHAVRQRRDDEWEDYCFRANVLIHGYEHAKSLWDTVRAMEGRV